MTSKQCISITLVICLSSCAKDQFFGNPTEWDKHLRVSQETITGDSGRTWVASSIVITRSEWNADSLRFDETGYIDYRDLKKQRFHFKPGINTNGSYIASDSLSLFLRIPKEGEFWTKENFNRQFLSFSLKGTSEPELTFKKWLWNSAALVCYVYYYDTPKVQYTIQAVLWQEN